jgi:hypothetical protein
MTLTASSFICYNLNQYKIVLGVTNSASLEASSSTVSSTVLKPLRDQAKDLRLVNHQKVYYKQ